METTPFPPLPLDESFHSHNSATKRKRSPSAEHLPQPTPPVKAARTHSSHLHINYLARQYSEILPLISSDDSLPSLLALIADYDGVLQRHESMAGNLGARPLGPILIQRFERLFDGPPRVLKTHGKEGTTIGWLDVVEFAGNKPEQFNLEKMRNGVRVCQFYTKQCRVEISEEDFQLVASGMPQRLIPPQPIQEDEEKELGTLEILEMNLGGVVMLADQVSARARQLNHRLKSRKNAIIHRREAKAAAKEESTHSPTAHQSNGDHLSPASSPTSGFVAVNSRQPSTNGQSNQHDTPQPQPRPNGTSFHGASAATKNELLHKFRTNSERQAPTSDCDDTRRSLTSIPRPSVLQKSKLKPSSDASDYSAFLLNSASPVPIPNTPSSLLPYVKPSPADRFDDSGPFKADMMLRMEQLNRGDRVQPPCDRCRRLHMDCLKNLTACMGCTRKHAKCSWKDVEEQELKDHPFVPRVVAEDDIGDKGSEGKGSDGESLPRSSGLRKEYSREEGVRDEELLGEDESGDEEGPRREEVIERHYSAQSLSPLLRPTMTSEPQPEKMGLEAAAVTPSASGVQPQAKATSPVTLNPASNSNGTTSDLANPASELFKYAYGAHQTPHAQMQPQSSSTHEINGTTESAHPNLMYNIYSQLHNEVFEKQGVADHRDEPMRVYTAGVGSEAIQLNGQCTDYVVKGDVVIEDPPRPEPPTKEQGHSLQEDTPWTHQQNFRPSFPENAHSMQVSSMPSKPMQSPPLQSPPLHNHERPMQTSRGHSPAEQDRPLQVQVQMAGQAVQI